MLINNKKTTNNLNHIYDHQANNNNNYDLLNLSPLSHTNSTVNHSNEADVNNNKRSLNAEIYYSSYNPNFANNNNSLLSPSTLLDNDPKLKQTSFQHQQQGMFFICFA
jgi:hypothetical protein